MSTNILVVEDSLVQAKMIEATMLNEGHMVFLLHDGTKILETMIDKKIDIALIDIVLPGHDGFELLEKIISCYETQEIPVIMVTSLTSGFDVKKALDLGAFDYVKKPIDQLELIARVNSALRLKSKQDQLKEFATKDRLTGLYNRTYFDEMLTRIIDEPGENEYGISIAMLDCDYFKRVNDTYGHVAGDIVLSSVANVITESTKNMDLVCRYGGEEFLIVFLNTSLFQGFRVCERIRENIAKLRFGFENEEIGITVSIGVAHLANGMTAEPLQLIDKADQALYAAKANGRNRVETSADCDIKGNL